MPDVSFLLVATIILALVFDYINGFHDTANAIATVVSTRVLTPRVAILLAAGLNFAGAMFATEVAKTVASGIVVPSEATEVVVLAAVVSAIVWNLVTWFYGIPSSSSHALIGGLVGAAMAHGGAGVVTWDGLLNKVVYPIFGSPIAGFVIGYILMVLIAQFFAHSNPGRTSRTFKTLQVASSSLMAFSHGQNDAQKSMGIITLALFTHGLISEAKVPLWVMLACAAAMALGTAAGGWRIMHTVGQKISRLDPVHGFAAETTSAIVILAAGRFGMPISTTQTITASIFGVASSRRLSAVRWNVAKSVILAWFITLPVAGALGACFCWLFGLVWR
jgi:inorganic phosphate transporter, PiT family